MSIERELTWQLCAYEALCCFPVLEMSTSYENSFQMYKRLLMELTKSLTSLENHSQRQGVRFQTSFKSTLVDIVHAIEAHVGDVRKRTCDLDFTGTTLVKLGELAVEIRSKLGGAIFATQTGIEDMARKVALFGFAEVMQLKERDVEKHSLSPLIVSLTECAAVALKAEEAAYRYRASIVSDRFCKVLGISDGQIWKASNILEAVHTAYRKNHVQAIFKVDALFPIHFDENLQSALDRVSTGNRFLSVPDVKPNFNERIAQVVKVDEMEQVNAAAHLHRVVCDLKLLLLRIQSILVPYVEECAMADVPDRRPAIEADFSDVSNHNSSGVCRCM